MDFRERKIGFREADRRYAALKRQHEAGTISDEQFDAQRRRLMVQDNEGRWWAKSRRTGEWHYHDGNSWVRGTPPDYQRPPPTPPLAAERTPGHRSQLPEQYGEKQRRGVGPRWLIMAAGLLAVMFGVVGIVVWMLVPGVSSDEEGPGAEEASGPAPGYQLVRHESGSLSVEVPSDWETDPSEYVNFEGDAPTESSESGDPSITASTDLYAWNNTGTQGAGVFFRASRVLAQEYTADQFLDFQLSAYSESCESFGTREYFSRSPYSGGMQEFSNCGMNSDHNILNVAATPEGGECLLQLQIAMYNEADREVAQHIMNSFEADCEGIS